MRTRQFFLSRDAINPDLAPGHGVCIATDEVTVEGRRVGFMYRDMPFAATDSGWLFLADTESEEYLHNPDNMGLFDVNIIANYDPEIIPFLGAPPGSAFERDLDTGDFTPAAFPIDPDEKTH
jgi:hypothetical protein